MSSPDVYRIQCRETGCWLSATGDRDLWVSYRDIRHATTFSTVAEAKHAAAFFKLPYARFRITTSTQMP
jgi:hypothetical protein